MGKGSEPTAQVQERRLALMRLSEVRHLRSMHTLRSDSNHSCGCHEPLRSGFRRVNQCEGWISGLNVPGLESSPYGGGALPGARLWP